VDTNFFIFIFLKGGGIVGPWQLIIIEAINHYDLLIVLIVCMIIILYGMMRLIIYKKINQFIALCDPLILTVLFQELTASIVPIYMYLQNWMYKPDDFIYSYISTEIAFWLGVIFFSCILNKSNLHFNAVCVSDNHRKNRRKLYWGYLILYFIIRGLYFYNCGEVPLFSEKYYTFFFEMSPIATRLSIDLYLIVSILCVDSLYDKKHKKINRFMGLLVVLTFILSGQKGLIIYIFSAFFFVEVYRFKTGQPMMNITRKKALIGVSIAFFIALIPLIITSLGNDDYSPIVAMLIRIIGNGDSFPLFYGLPQTSPILFENTGIFNYIWANMASFHFRFGYDIDHLPTTELKWIMDSALGEYVVPLIRHNIIAIKVLGIEYGWIYSLFIGSCIGIFTRYIFNRISGFNFYIYLIICLVYEAVVEMIAVYQVVIRFEAVILNVFIISIFYFIFESKFKDKNIVKREK